MVKGYQDNLSELKSRLLEGSTIRTEVSVKHVDLVVSRVLNEVEEIGMAFISRSNLLANRTFSGRYPDDTIAASLRPRLSIQPRQNLPTHDSPEYLEVHM